LKKGQAGKMKKGGGNRRMRSEKQRKDGDLNREETLSKRHQQTKGNPRHEGGEHLSL